MQQFTFSISERHPSLAGHFPGHPVVPGVLLLDELLAGVNSIYPDLLISGFKQVKFIRPVLPGEQIRVQVKMNDSGGILFNAYLGDDRVFMGDLNTGAAV